MSDTVNGNSGKAVRQAMTAEPDTGRRSLALSLLGALGASTLLKGCASAGGSIDEGAAYDPEPSEVDGVQAALSGTNNIRWFDTMASMRAFSIGSATRYTAIVHDRSVVGDQGGGVFVWRASGAVDDGKPGTGLYSGVIVNPLIGGIINPAAAAGWRRLYSGSIDVRWFGAVGTTPTVPQDGAFATAYAAASTAGKALYVPAGRYLLSAPLQMLPPSSMGSFGNGPRIVGDGIGATIFINGVVGAAMFDVAAQGGTPTSFRGALGCHFSGFTVTREAETTAGTAIKLRAAYLCKLEQIHIIGMSGNGIEIQCSVGDNDASSMVNLEHVRIENCAGWGIKADADVGFNETSFTTMVNVFIQGCGTPSAATPPPSGGMVYKGQILSMVGCAFTINENVALYIPGQAGLGVNVDIRDTGFENSVKRGLYCTGIGSFKAKNIQFFNNDSYVSTVGCEFDGGVQPYDNRFHTVRQVDIDGVLIRATGGNNPYTAFKLFGAGVELDSCRVRNVDWGNFDHPGQVRFDGWKFDSVGQLCDLAVLDANTLVLTPNAARGRGNSMPLRLSGAGGGVPSTSGEWIETNIDTNGASISAAGLGPDTRYFCYLWDDSGARKLSLSTTGTAVDSVSGYAVMSGDVRKLYVGSVETDGAGFFKLSGSGWLNPLRVPGSVLGAYWYMWMDGSGRLRVSSSGSPPTGDTSGTVAGTQA